MFCLTEFFLLFGSFLTQRSMYRTLHMYIIRQVPQTPSNTILAKRLATSCLRRLQFFPDQEGRFDLQRHRLHCVDGGA
jgi:hypothetical protein